MIIVISNWIQFAEKYLTVSNWIQIIGIIVTFITTLVSLWIALRSLRLSKKSIDMATESAEQTKLSAFNANRPYVVAYTTSLDSGLMSIHKYLIIKNFGKSAAMIHTIHTSDELDDSNSDKKLESLTNFTLAPGMSIPATVDSNFMETVTFNIVYSDLDNHKFEESFPVNFGFMSSVRFETSSIANLPEGFNELIAAINVVSQQIQQK